MPTALALAIILVAGDSTLVCRGSAAGLRSTVPRVQRMDAIDFGIRARRTRSEQLVSFEPPPIR